MLHHARRLARTASTASASTRIGCLDLLRSDFDLKAVRPRPDSHLDLTPRRLIARSTQRLAQLRTAQAAQASNRADLGAQLDRATATLLLITVRGITDAQAAQRATVRELTLGGIVKHMACGEQVWTQILVEGTESCRRACSTLGSTAWPRVKHSLGC
ncbi:mycothiol transferase [Streptomyces sp. NBC_01320]|uniref:mycothiol transferase n=1 Tax=Streptomyces sp. NBC_01320 TaxID=2903824 RepID=UPI003FA348F6